MSTPFDALRAELRQYTDGGKTERALNKLTFAASAAAADFTPVDTGTLINSRFMSVVNMGSFIDARVGYTAEYARWVANMPGKLKGQPRAHFGRTSTGVEFGGGTEKGRYWDPNAEPDFLNKGFNRSLEEDWPLIVEQDLTI